jgi:hypothetical protein
MAMKEQQRQVYRTMQGVEIDMGKLMNQNEMTVAVGNVKVNARGDELGPGGKILRTREEILRDSQPSGPVPEQMNVRAETAPAPVAPAKKDVSSMDPEGKE